MVSVVASRNIHRSSGRDRNDVRDAGSLSLFDRSNDLRLGDDVWHDRPVPKVHEFGKQNDAIRLGLVLLAVRRTRAAGYLVAGSRAGLADVTVREVRSDLHRVYRLAARLVPDPGALHMAGQVVERSSDSAIDWRSPIGVTGSRQSRGVRAKRL